MHYLREVYNFKHPEDAKSIQITEIFRLEFKDLLGRSDNLDKVRSNLRNGTSIILAIGTAISVWLMNYSITPEISHQLLFVASVFLVVMTLISVLLSFSDSTLHVGIPRIQEGLLPNVETKEEYQKIKFSP